MIEQMDARGLDGKAIEPLAIVLDQEPGLNPVWNWQKGAPPALPRSPIQPERRLRGFAEKKRNREGKLQRVCRQLSLHPH